MQISSTMNYTRNGHIVLPEFQRGNARGGNKGRGIFEWLA